MDENFMLPRWVFLKWKYINGGIARRSKKAKGSLNVIVYLLLFPLLSRIM